MRESFGCCHLGGGARVFELNNITMHFGAVTVLKDLSVELQHGDRLGLRGKNGSGKSTLINISTGFLKPSSGRILMRGNDLTGKPAWSFARAGIARTFQRPRIQKNCLLGSQLGLDQRSTARAREILERRIELDAFADELPLASLRLFEVARALATQPRMLFLDEPSAGLSETESEALASCINRHLPHDCILIVAEHRTEFMSRLTDRIWIIKDAVLTNSAERELLDA